MRSRQTGRQMKGCIAICVILLAGYMHTRGQSDTVASPVVFERIHSLQGKLSLSSSYSNYSNWSSGSHNNFSFQGNGDVCWSQKRHRHRQYHTFRTALTYVKYVDSLWVKAVDYWKLNLRFTDRPEKHFTHAYTLLLASQWLDSYRYIRRNETLVKEKRGSFFNPGTATLAYGISWSFWNLSSVSFSFASVKIATKPRYISPTVSGEDFARTSTAYIYSEYGMCLQADIEKKLADNILWENHSTFFANGIGKSRVQGNFVNAVSFRFLRFMEFRVDTHIAYDPLYSYKLQFLHGFRLGFLLDVRNGKINKNSGS